MIVLAGCALAALAALAVVRPRALILLTVGLDATNVSQVVGDQVGTSPFRPLLVLCAVAVLVLARRGRLRWAWSPVLTTLLVVYGVWALTIAVSASPAVSLSVFDQHLRDLVYLFLVWVLVMSTDSWRAVLQVAVGGLAVIAAITLVHQFVLHDAGTLYGLSNVPLVQEQGSLTPRHAGTLGDVNFWGRLLVLVIPSAMSLVAMSRGWARAAWTAGVLALAGGLYLTQSRGSFLALGVAVLVWFVVAGRRYWKLLAYLPLTALLLIPIPGVGSRVATLANIAPADGVSVPDQSLVTRLRFQQDAWRMFLDRPVLGHGLGTYPVIFNQYDRFSDKATAVDITVAAHNFYLEQLADGGVVLLLAWLLFLGSVIVTAMRVVLLARAAGEHAAEITGVGIIAGVAGWLTASAFLHLSEIRVLFLMAAVAGLLEVRCRGLVTAADDPVPIGNAPPTRPGAPRGRSATWHRRPQVRVIGAVAAVTLVAASATAVTESRPARYTDTVLLPVVVADTSATGSNAYLIALLDRVRTVPTLAEAVRYRLGAVADGHRVDGVTARISIPDLGGSVQLAVTGSNPAVVAAQTRRLTEQAVAALTSLHTPYRLLDLGAPLTLTPPGQTSPPAPEPATGGTTPSPGPSSTPLLPPEQPLQLLPIAPSVPPASAGCLDAGDCQ